MVSFHALPDLNVHADGVLWVGLSLVLATLMGESVLRFLRWPRLIGYLGAGVVIAAGGGGLQALDLPAGARALIDAALAMILFEIGHRVNLRWLRANPWLLAIGVGDWVLSTAAGWLGLRLYGLDGPQALGVAAALACAAPEVALRLSGEFNARGQVTERLLLLSTLGTVLSILGVGLATGWAGAQLGPNWLSALLRQAYALGGAVLAAAALAWAVHWVERHFDCADEGAALLLVGLILLVLSLTRMLHWSNLLTPLLGGLLLRLQGERPRLWPRHFGTAGGALVVLLFLILGLSLNAQVLILGAGAGVLIALLRALAKLIAPLALGPASGLSLRQSLALGLSLNPAAGVSFVLLLNLSAYGLTLPVRLFDAAFAALGVLALAGTLGARWALGRTADIGATPAAPNHGPGRRP